MSLGLELYQNQLPREEIIAPFVEVFNQQANKNKNQFSITDALDAMFPEQKRQDKDLARIKEAFGELAKEFNEVELKEVATDVDFLVATWLDDFEKTLFDGQTLREVLHEKGGIL